MTARVVLLCSSDRDAVPSPHPDEVNHMVARKTVRPAEISVLGQGRRSRWTVALWYRRISLVTAVIWCVGCSPSARYVIVSDDVKQISAAQRFIYVSQTDAQKAPGLLGLYKQSDITEYAEKRKASDEPLETVLYHIVHGQYDEATEVLKQQAERLSPYLRLTVQADLAMERSGYVNNVDQVVRLYQDAYEAQTTDLGRSIIQLRLRQMRYRR